eukprot:353244-Chlamydomonas_euryale.AAC.11
MRCAPAEEDDSGLDPLVREFRAMERDSVAAAPWIAPAAFAAAGGRGLLRSLCTNATFAVTGSLGCSFAAAAAADGALAVCCEAARPGLPSVEDLLPPGQDR